MKMKNKLIFACILALIVCVLLVPCAFAQEAGEEFVEVEVEELEIPAEETVDEMVEEPVEETTVETIVETVSEPAAEPEQPVAGTEEPEEEIPLMETTPVEGTEEDRQVPEDEPVPVLCMARPEANNPGIIDDVINTGSLPSIWGTEGEESSYTVTESCTIEDRIEVKGNVSLLLNDGVTLTLPMGIHLVAGNSLTINAQSSDENMGKLIATGSDGNAAIGGNAGLVDWDKSWGDDGEAGGTLIVNGGDVTAKGVGKSRGFGGGRGAEGGAYITGGNGGAGGNLTISGGACSFSAETGAAIGGGTGGNATQSGKDGAATELNPGEKITVQAGKDAEHATDTEYTKQSYARFGESMAITFEISGKDPFSRNVVKGYSVADPLLTNDEKYAAWYTDAGFTTGYDFSKPVVENMNLYGAWIASPNVYEYTRWDAQGNPTVEKHTFHPNDSHVIRSGNLPTIWGDDGAETLYVVAESCTIGNRIEIKGKINLILADGAELTLPKGIHLIEGNTLNVFSVSQTGESMGKLTVTGIDGNAAIGGNTGYGESGWARGNDGDACGALTVHGGALTVKGLGNSRGFGGGRGGIASKTTETGATGGTGGAGGSLSILGGACAFSSESGAAIGGGSGGSAAITGAEGAATQLSLGAQIVVQAGTDADHATDTEYNNQSYVLFGEPVSVTFVISGNESFSRPGVKGLSIADPLQMNNTECVVWYTDSDLKNVYDFSRPVMGNMTLYGKWETSPCVYEYTRRGAQSNSTVETIVFHPNDPHRIHNDNLPSIWGTEGKESSYIVTESCTIDERIEVRGTVTLLLNDGVTLTLPMGIHLMAGNSLTINAQSSGENMGKLIATGSDGNAAIGGNAGLGDLSWYEANAGEACGALTVNGGIITVNASGETRGFGGGHGGEAFYVAGNGGDGGSLTISDGACFVSSELGAAIGGGTGGYCEYYGEKYGDDGAATELNPGEKITVQAGEDAEHATEATYTDQHYARFGESMSVTFEIPEKETSSQVVLKGFYAADPMLAKDAKYAVWYTDAGLTSKYDFSRPVVEDITLYGKWEDSPYAYEYTRRDAQGNPTVETITFHPNDSHLIHKDNLPVIWGDDGAEVWYVITESCTIDERIEVKGNLNLILADGAELTLPKGIHLIEGNSLNIFSISQTGESMGKLTVTGIDGNAAIGGNAGLGDLSWHEANAGESCGALIVHGGAITVKGLGNSRGFGGGSGGEARDYGGNGGNGGSVSILGGMFTASSEFGAAIGGGSGGGALFHPGSDGTATELSLGAKIKVQAGKDAEHATDTAYTNQSYACFGESLTIKKETQSPQQKEITIQAADGNTVNIRATVTGNTVTVKNISAHDIRTVLDAENVTKELTIDCSGIADVKVTKVNLQLSSLKVIAGSEASKVNVIMSCGSIAMDKDALLYIAENMKGSSATFVIEEADENNLNEAQKETIRAEEKLIAVIDTYILSDSAKQRELGSSKVTLTVSDTGIRNYDPATLRLFEIREDGTKREISFRIVDGGIEFEADCLATYMFIN